MITEQTIEPSVSEGLLPERAPRNAALIVNTKSRKGRQMLALAQERLQADGITLDSVHALKNPTHLEALVRGLIGRGAKFIIVGGGDGSYSSVVDLLAHTDITLGILPLGTVNDFARNLSIPPDMEGACKVISEGCVAKVDLGLANDNYFTITASFGFSAESQKLLKPWLKRVFGPFAYILASLLALSKMRPMTIRVKSEQGEETMKVVQAGVINGHYWMGGAFEVPNQTLQSGKMVFYAAPPQTGREYFALVGRLLKNRYFATLGLKAFPVEDVTIITQKKEHLVIDGDVQGKTPVRFRVAPDALRVCVPADFCETS